MVVARAGDWGRWDVGQRAQYSISKMSMSGALTYSMVTVPSKTVFIPGSC